MVARVVWGGWGTIAAPKLFYLITLRMPSLVYSLLIFFLRRAQWMPLLACSALFLPTAVQAKGSSIPTVMLIAPEEVRALLKEHFALPEKLLKGESERAQFMRRAQREIPELLVTEGYFSSRVVLRAVQHSGTLEVKVELGVRARVNQVNIEFRGDIVGGAGDRALRMQQLREDWKFQADAFFTAAAWDEAKQELLARLNARDYAAAQLVESVAQVDVAKASVALHVVVDSGARYQFGEVRLGGLVRYPETMLTRFADFEIGQPYARQSLLNTQTRLQNLAQFNSVIVSLDKENALTGADGVRIAPVNVQVVEAQSRKVAVGLGYSTNNGVRSELNYLDLNLAERAWTLNGALVLENNRQQINVGIDTLPNPRGLRVQWNAGTERTYIQGLETWRDKLGVTRSQRVFGVDNSLGLSWQQERRFPNGGIRENNQALVLDWRVQRRTVDNPLFPTWGSLSELRVGGTGKLFLSDQDFVRSYLRHQLWTSLTENDVISTRGEVGYTATPSRLGVPQEYLFRVGGTQTVRGFAYQSLGMHEGDAVVGGRVMATASVEYTHWFNNWGLAVFSDAGDAADTVEAFRARVGWGGGLRWRSPVGPLALDFARGRSQLDTLIHFSIAVAF